ncbi:GNAT family N-acetyltransferase [Vibrio coralliilyticus]|uniref:GNAT family N-acetyltransferase n=1 Tax=Vibrio coralliilyticus TaxID=190893 RepID=UPI0020A29DA8|nr:GNAT family N-acetyltransferase [Vibrio coralliilyticus]
MSLKVMEVPVEAYRTNRLTIRQFKDGDRNAHFLSEIQATLTEKVVENLPPYFHQVRSNESAETWLSKMNDESVLYVVRANDGALAGFVFVYQDSGSAHIGYLLAEEYWGQGLASELLTGFIDSIANKSGWRELVAGVDESNIASLKLLEKLGFVKQSMNEQRVVFYQYGLKNNSESEE